MIIYERVPPRYVIDKLQALAWLQKHRDRDGLRGNWVVIGCAGLRIKSSPHATL